MSDPYLGEIRTTAFVYAPRGWAMCNGQTLSISQNTALFSLLGFNYGGDGRSTFGLPNLQGRIPVHPGDGFILGEAGGEEQHTLSGAEMASHTHQPASASTATVASPAGAVWAPAAAPVFGGPADEVMAANAVGSAGGNQPHENRPPFLVINFIIALVGIFPSRS